MPDVKARILRRRGIANWRRRVVGLADGVGIGGRRSSAT